jgi:hypothetical protein
MSATTACIKIEGKGAVFRRLVCNISVVVISDHVPGTVGVSSSHLLGNSLAFLTT